AFPVELNDAKDVGRNVAGCLDSQGQRVAPGGIRGAKDAESSHADAPPAATACDADVRRRDVRRRLAEEANAQVALVGADLDVVEAVEAGRAHIVATLLIAAHEAFPVHHAPPRTNDSTRRSCVRGSR